MEQGTGTIIASHSLLKPGAPNVIKVMHGVETVTAGHRRTLGIIPTNRKIPQPK